jgi:DsbC/DsbD-like thiol-disulfide interchange protein
MGNMSDRRRLHAHQAAALAGSLLFATAAAAPARSADASPWDNGTHWATRLIAASATESGLRAGLEIKLDSGWKTYWRYPGDSGVPPVFDFSGSENVSSVNVLWPVPQRFPDGSGGHAIGYAGHVILPLQVIPQAAGKPVTLRLKLAYGVCEKLCVPVETRAELPLAGRSSVHDQAVAAAEARVPRPATLGDGGKLAIRAVRQEPASPPGSLRPRVIVDVAAPDAAKVDLFAEGPTTDWALPLPEPVPSAPGMRRFAFELDGLPSGAKAAGAALRLTAVAGEEAIEVPIRLD